jgi:ubiquinone/menaquinone biosynthesis C-methylase UbiE
MKMDNDRNSVPRADAMVKIYLGPKFAAWSTNRPRLYSHEERLVEKYCGSQELAIINVGCGAGRETLGFYDLGFHHVHGVDLNPRFVDMANEECRKRGVNVPFTVASADRLPFPDASFDLMTMFENLYGHITPQTMRATVLAEAKRVLKPGGLLFIEATSLNESYAYMAWFKAMGIIHRLYNPCCLEPGDKLIQSARQTGAAARLLPRSHWFKPREIDREGQEAGFEVVQASTVMGVLADPSRDMRKYRGMGRLIYALRRPKSDTLFSNLASERPRKRAA